MIRVLLARPCAAEDILIREAGLALKETRGSVSVVVPSLLTLQTELTLIHALEPNGSVRINVLSPQRLCGRIFDSAGRPSFSEVDDRGRVMIARRVLNDLEKQMRVYTGAGHRRGVPARLARQIEIFRQAGYDAGLLEELSGLTDGLLSAKLKDLSVLMRGYEDALLGRFMDGEQEYLAAAAYAADAGPFRGSAVFFYGFDLLSVPQQELICALGACTDVTWILAADGREASDRLVFAPLLDCLARAEELFRKSGAACERVLCEEEPVPVPPGIRALRRQLFAARIEPEKDNTGGVRLLCLRDPAEEALFVAASCRALAVEQGEKWNGMMVVMPDADLYAHYLEDAFAAYGIPIFLSTSRPASRHPLAEALNDALRLIWKGYRTEDALALLRTGYSDADAPDLLAGYLARYSPKGRELTQPFTRGREEEAALAEEQREKLIGPVLALQERLRNAGDLGAQLEAVFGYLEQIDAYSKSETRQRALMASGQASLSGETAQVWNRIVSTLDQMYDLMGEKRLSLEDLTETIRESLDQAVIKPLPQSGDAVYAQGLDRPVLRRARHVFLIGLSDRTYLSTDGLLQLGQAEQLEQISGKWLCIKGLEHSEMRRYCIRSAAAAAQKTFTVLRPLSAEDGSPAAQSMMIPEIMRVLPGLKEEGGEELERIMARLRVSAPRAALRQPGSGSGDAVRTLIAMKDPAAMQRRDALKRRGLPEQLDRQTAGAIYRGETTTSISRLETFIRCPFSYFLKYGLHPTETKPYELDLSGEGELFHEAVRLFLDENRSELSRMDPADAVDSMHTAMSRAIEELRLEEMLRDPLAGAKQGMIADRLETAARTIVKQMENSSFEPVELELDFSGLSGGLVLRTKNGPVSLKGRLDRVDSWKASDDREFLRVIDYKRGNAQLRLYEVYEGIQLQLILYLASAMKRRGSSGAGVYYFDITDGIVTTDSLDREQIEQGRKKLTALRGLTLKDRDVVEAMTDDPDGVLNVGIKRDGEFYQSSLVADEDELRLLIDRARSRAEGSAERILDGDVRRLPVRSRDTDACRWCDARTECMFDPLLDRVRSVRYLNTQEVFERLREERGE